jgi:uncharacterized protein
MNKLSNSTSPYLQQHAHNPVDWFPWSEEAFAKARTENKPIFLSIGYAACHWCHVMAHESFEDPEVAAFMNEHFVNIKVDREERPDIDSIYMQATVAMTGSGGWPMSVFLTPDLKPFYTGTYFPPVPRHNMPSFRDVLAGIARSWKEERDEITRVGGQVSDHLQQAIGNTKKSESTITKDMLDSAAKAMIDSYDWNHGGWGAAPKFPQPMSIEFLLRRTVATPKEEQQELKAVVHALTAMARGGMYDVVGGGFSRYSVDNFWRVPHFEKMLYDNAQLVRVYLHAWQLTDDPFFKRIVIETLEFIDRELTHPDGGFYSSLDADSEGEEGRFYVWSLEEVRDILEQDADFFEAAYGVSARGNWEGKNVLQRILDDSSLAARFKIGPETVPAKLAECHAKLLTARSKRIRPGTDDKVLTAWNGLMLAAVAEAARVLEPGNKYYEMARRNANFLLTSLRSGNRLKRSWRDGRITDEVFLEDYAALILGLLELYQTDFDNRWFTSARELADEMIDLFEDPHGGFFDTPRDGEILLLRPKDVQDNATPSGNALACEALLKLAAFTAEGRYRDLAEKALGLVSDFVARYPTAFAHWLSAADFALGNVKQVAAVYEAEAGPPQEVLRFIQSAYRPNAVISASPYPPPKDAPPLLGERPLKDKKTTVYVCEGFVCKNPVTTIHELEDLL